jgi:hypothetical protein
MLIEGFELGKNRAFKSQPVSISLQIEKADLQL